MTKACLSGNCVGIVPDGIAGIFTDSNQEEEVKLLHRKGLAKLCLKHGLTVVPAYSHGNTDAFHTWYDKWGIMEWLSRKFRVSLFIPYGRWGLPIPFRCNITMAYADPITPARKPNPTQEEIDALHQQILEGMRHCFDSYKAALGHGHKKLVFV
eukprot:CAMPEP_0175167606 /NCGR_PEP_ID=MMETSP0087-20121206/28444_1 /TAXON_ID=136419 /ORGANISM="Unknown Unknown, Strain D1" /LENGTH=153 /DNA_ID=CAMNT_0016457531 /DNA_START=501 /DNA_END=962 /DNA_ORIENTATION=-